MLDQKSFGAKLRHHRKKVGLTQEEVAEKIGVSAQAVSKWEVGDCLPDCFNLKSISDVYQISVDVLLETETSGTIDTVSRKIEQLGTELIWSNAGNERYGENPRHELGDELWKMWKGLYFTEVGNQALQENSKRRGNLRISGKYGMKIWDDDGVACIVQSSLIKNLQDSAPSPQTANVLRSLCTEEGQTLMLHLSCQHPLSKETLLKRTNIEASRLNELLLLLTENKVIEFVSDSKIAPITGYKISGHCGIAAYMLLAAVYILDKKEYCVSEYYEQD